jgi:alkanesulfonate monooxygenase SsuD/methylene tetrahydromethanopterin reductase-like flavin-dependent oxidoreductase (luciferase family)
VPIEARGPGLQDGVPASLNWPVSVMRRHAEASSRIYPPPVQKQPQIWITASGNPQTFAQAGQRAPSC